MNATAAADAPRGVERALGVFWRPLPLAALALMAANDHWGKVAFPGLVTGKLSDLAVVLYFPALLTACFGLAALATAPLARRLGARVALDPAPTRARLHAGAAITALGLAAINLSPALRDLYVRLLGAVDVGGLASSYRYVVDPTDLVALLLLPLALRDGRRAIALAEGDVG